VNKTIESIKKLNRKNNFKQINVGLNENILALRFQLIKQLPNYLCSFKSNISYDQYKTLINFSNKKPFKIIDTDKNTGAAIISNELYIELAHTHLNDNKIYEKLKLDPSTDTFNIVTNKLNELMISNNISKSLHSILLPNLNNKIGKFRFLAKLHKEEFGIRPIINFKNHVTEKISMFFDNLLKPIITNTKSFIKDSQNLLQICNKINFNRKLELYSCDFNTLYTNIQLADAIYYTMDCLIETLDNTHFTPTGLFEMLKLVLLNNVFQFNKVDFYKQIRGLAMGSNLGPAIANIVVYKLESKWLDLHSPTLYSRFIDDIFIGSETKLDLTEFKNNFDYLKLNIVHDKKVQFLDLEISFDEIFNKINFSLYIKKTNTFSYLNINSNHPSHIFKNIPKSLFIRVRRICTQFSDYLYYCSLIYLHLIQCGYDAIHLKNMILMVAKIDRKMLIEYKPKMINTYFKGSFNFKLKYNNQLNLRDLILINLNKMIDNNQFPKINLQTYFSVNNNLRDILIHGKRFCNYGFHKNNKCNASRCKTCLYMDKIKTLKFKNGLELPLLNTSDCNAHNCIYILHCEICDSFYIGQSSFFKKRFPNHISSINNFKYNKFECEIAKHFNQQDHYDLFKKSLKWTIFVKNIINVKLRLSTEQEVIRLFLECGEKVLNEKIYNNSIKNFLTGLKLV
jgi:hypothetical protein